MLLHNHFTESLYVYIHTQTCKWLYTHTHTRVYVFTCLALNADTRSRAHTHTNTHTHTQTHTQAHTHTHKHTHMPHRERVLCIGTNLLGTHIQPTWYTHTYIPSYMVRAYTQACIHTYTYMHTYKQTCMHTWTHIHRFPEATATCSESTITCRARKMKQYVVSSNSHVISRDHVRATVRLSDCGTQSVVRHYSLIVRHYCLSVRH